MHFQTPAFFMFWAKRMQYPTGDIFSIPCVHSHKILLHCTRLNLPLCTIKQTWGGIYYNSCEKLTKAIAARKSLLQKRWPLLRRQALIRHSPVNDSPHCRQKNICKWPWLKHISQPLLIHSTHITNTYSRHYTQWHYTSCIWYGSLAHVMHRKRKAISIIYFVRVCVCTWQIHGVLFAKPPRLMST